MLSQEATANLLNISRTTWSGYEQGKSEPNTSALIKICKFFNISTDDILFKDIEKPVTSEGKSVSLKDEQIRVLAITISEHQKQNIEFVPVKAVAGYAQNFSDINFIGDLPHFSIPKLKEGTYRAFEIQGDSMQPINEGYIIIGKYVESVNKFCSNKRYVLILREEGVVFKRMFKDKKIDNQIILVSDNPEFLPFTVLLTDVLEAWEMVAFIGFGDKAEDNSTFLMQKITNIEQIVNQISKLKN